MATFCVLWFGLIFSSKRLSHIFFEFLFYDISYSVLIVHVNPLVVLTVGASTWRGLVAPTTALPVRYVVHL